MLCELTNEISGETGTPVGSILCILHKDLNIYYLCHNMAPKMLTPKLKETAGDLINMADKDIDFLKNITTGYAIGFCHTTALSTN
jgi:hypothetical protein